MHRTYQIITDATADMVPEMLVGLPEVQVIPMGVTLGEKAYTYGPGGDITVEEFYAAQRDASLPPLRRSIRPFIWNTLRRACRRGRMYSTSASPPAFGDLPDSLALCSGTPGKDTPKAKVI